MIAGTWNLPFAFILAFTGSYFSFGSALGIPAVAMVAFGGDQEKMIEAVVGNPPAIDETPATMAVATRRAVRACRARSGVGSPWPAPRRAAPPRRAIVISETSRLHAGRQRAGRRTNPIVPSSVPEPAEVARVARPL